MFQGKTNRGVGKWEWKVKEVELECGSEESPTEGEPLGASEASTGHVAEWSC